MPQPMMGPPIPMPMSPYERYVGQPTMVDLERMIAPQMIGGPLRGAPVAPPSPVGLQGQFRQLPDGRDVFVVGAPAQSQPQTGPLNPYQMGPPSPPPPSLRQLLGLGQAAAPAPAQSPTPPLPQIFGATGPAVAQGDITPAGPVRTLDNGMTHQAVGLAPQAFGDATAPLSANPYAAFVAQVTGDPMAARGLPPARVNSHLLNAFTQMQVADRGLAEAELRQRNGILDQIIAAHAINNPGATAEEMAAERARLAPGFGMGASPAAMAGPSPRSLLSQFAFPRTPGMAPGAPAQRAPIEQFLQAAINRPGFNLNDNIGDVMQFLSETYGGSDAGSFTSFWNSRPWAWQDNLQTQMRQRLADAINSRIPGTASPLGWTSQYYRPLPPDLPARLRGNRTPISP